MNYLYKDLTYRIIGAAMEVHKELGPGFLESVYEEAFIVELKRLNISFEQQKKYYVNYKGIDIKEYYCDLVIDDKVIVELKAIKQIGDIERAQILNYLKVTKLRLGLLINFGGESLEYERIIK
ncbi:MAG: GxxExxY protein [Candidatus Marinimicrobia bacterium]|nr:GxxExxY protein [Candidatus Neomarinimicrobiota bacterium]